MATELRSLCQRCASQEYHWTIKQADLHVGRLEYWKVQLCESCTERLEQAILTTLGPLTLAREEPR